MQPEGGIDSTRYITIRHKTHSVENNAPTDTIFETRQATYAHRKFAEKV